MKYLLVLSLFLFSKIIFAESATIQEMCKLPQAEIIIHTKNETEESVCRLADQFNTSELKTLADTFKEIVLKSEENRTAYLDEFSQTLDEILKNLNKVKPSSFQSVKKDSTAKGLEKLFSNFGTEQARWNSPETYVQALREVLSHSDEGKQVIKCFDDKSDPRVVGTIVEFLPESESAGETGGGGASFETRERDDGKFDKVITIDLGTRPEIMIAGLAHEMQHACSSSQFIDLTLAVFQSKTYQEREENMKNYTVQSAIDEMKAYELMVKVFKSYTPYHPEYFCHNYFKGRFFGLQVMGFGEYMSNIETQMKDGNRFALQLIESYRYLSDYETDYFFIIDKPEEFGMDKYKRDDKNQPVLRPEVYKMFAEAGYKIE